MTKEKAIKELVKYDHALLSPETAIKLTKPFGFTPAMREHTDTRNIFKGLTLYGLNEKTGKDYQLGDTTMGVEAHSLAIQIAGHLKVKYTPMFGIGSQLREVCEKISQFLN